MTNTEARLVLILEECLDAIDRDGVSVADCLARYPDDRERLAPLLTTAVRLRTAAESTAPSVLFRQTSVQRLQTRLTPRRRTNYGRWRRIAAAAAAIALIATVGSGAGLAYADTSAPGDVLYGVDQSTEQIQILLANEERALTLRAGFLDERLSEAEQLANEGDIPHLSEALNNYDQAAGALAEALSGSGVSDEEVLAKVDAALSNHEMRLQEVLDKVPEQAQQGILRAIEASQNGRAHAQQALENRGKPENTPGNGPPENPGSNGQGHGKDKDDDHPGQGQNNGNGNGQGPPGDKPGNGNQADD